MMQAVVNMFDPLGVTQPNHFYTSRWVAPGPSDFLRREIEQHMVEYSWYM